MNLATLKTGYIRENKIFPQGTNRQIKIGSKTYIRLIKLYPPPAPKQNKTLTTLKQGYVRSIDINPQGTLHQIKIGSITYNRLINRYPSSAPKLIKKDNNNIKIAKAGSKPIKGEGVEEVESKINNLEDIRELVRSKHKFTSADRSKTLKILKEYSNQNYLFNFKLKGSEDFSKEMYTLRNDNLDELVDNLANKYYDTLAGGIIHGSDVIEKILLQGIADFQLIQTISKKKKTKKIFKNNKDGHFFRYLNTTNINLERYQIITKDSNKNILNEHCLIYALKQAGVNDTLLNRIKTTFQQGSSFAKLNLKSVAEILKRKIILIELPTSKKEKKRKLIIGKAYEDPITIALFENHYFINETTIYTSFSIKHYDELKDIKDFHEISDKQTHHYGKYSRKKAKKISSLDVIKILFENNNFKKDDILLTYTPDYQELNNNKMDILEGIDQEQKEFKFRQKETKTRAIFYADTETDTTDNHKSILLGVLKDTKSNISSVRTFVNRDNSSKFWFEFMNYISRNSQEAEEVIIYFHKLKYDYNVLLPYLYLSGSPCQKDGNMYSVSFVYKKRKFELRDSYKLINISLAKFQETFALDKSLNKKEAIAYDYYKLSNMKNELIQCSDYEKFLKPEEIKIFRQAIKKNEYDDVIPKKGWFNPISYYRYYLKYDCFILMKGLQIFKQSIDVISEGKIDMHDYLTISSLTNALMSVNGAFNGVYEMSGNLRDFCSKAVTGGRVQTNIQYEKQLLNGKFADYDGVSLYPSAISRLCKEKGLPIGKCRQIRTKIKSDLDEYSYYIVKIKISKINKHQQLPMCSFKDEEGLLQYVNVIDKPIISYVDMITLTDWIEFQEIEYEILEGVYWNDGYNSKMGDIINNLFEERSKHKKDKNEAMQQILKFMMNSAYGKTIKKKTVRKNVLTYTKYRDEYIHNNFNTIRKIVDINDKQSLIEVDTLDDSYNMSHVGSFILSYSKRIMNEVFDIANSNKYPLYYTDTDSIHCNYDDVPCLEKKFKEKYNRELTGQQLGQFHVDFKLKGAVGEIYATKSIFLGKKSYIDQLESIDKDGEKIKDYHYRMKGCTPSGLIHKANSKFGGDMFKLYSSLLNGQELKIVMNPPNFKPMFEYSENAVSTRLQGEFIRRIQF